jgi:hypothetical protein
MEFSGADPSFQDLATKILYFRENMDKKTADRVVQLMNSTPQIDTLDLTGKCSKWHHDPCHLKTLQ